MQTFTLTFDVLNSQHAHLIASTLKARSLELGGYRGMTFEPLLSSQPPLESEEAASLRLAKINAIHIEQTKAARDAQTAVEPLEKFGRVWS